jgi:hypothetical protein
LIVVIFIEIIILKNVSWVYIYGYLNYYLDGQFPLPPPDGLPVVLGPFGGVHVLFPMRTPLLKFKCF